MRQLRAEAPSTNTTIRLSPEEFHERLILCAHLVLKH